MLIVEETFLLLTKDNGAAERVSRYRRHGLVAALLTDLAGAGVIDVGEGRDPRVAVVRAGTTGDPVLDASLPALDRLSGKRISALLASPTLDPERAVGHALARQGIVREIPRRFRAPHYVTTSPAPEIALRQRLGEVLAGTREATRADGTVLGILKALNLAYGLLGPARGDLDRRGLARRIVAVSQENPAVAALQRRVGTIPASTTVAVTAAGAAGAA
ncbi:MULTISPECIES: GOLPH3/VPS74 family protein [Citricoccus]|uniref:GOLPH3/VPS74 family protein n=1 Tax=Citricoccus TaxID=169133 RepID=UPI000255F348|nr:GPP34 family phosphoprotein [Citricoccus sp. CH26A]